MKKPIIGILPRCDIDSEYDKSIQYVFDGVRNAIIQSGGIPFIITPPNNLEYYKTKWNDFTDFTNSELEIIDYYLDMCDGLFLPGGYKITKFDKVVIEKAIDKDIPILGVCLGMQTLNAYRSDFMNRVIESEVIHKQNETEKYAHKVKIKKDSILYNIIGREEIEVNSFHTREVYVENPHFNIVAHSLDGVIEAIEMKNKTFVVGVQWHPEKMLDFDNNSRLLMNYFIEQAIKYHKNKNSKLIKL